MSDHPNHLVDPAPDNAIPHHAPAAHTGHMVGHSGDEPSGHHARPSKQLQPRAHDNLAEQSGMERAMFAHADKVHPPTRR